MKVRCRKCEKEMQYPFRECRYCGWVPEGKFRERAEKFASAYKKEYPDMVDPNSEKKRKGPSVKIKKDDRTIAVQHEIAIQIPLIGIFKGSKDKAHRVGYVLKTKVKCVQCKREMRYPFLQCTRCGWVPTGKYLDVARNFAVMYRKDNPETEDALLEIERSEEERVAPIRKSKTH